MGRVRTGTHGISFAGRQPPARRRGHPHAGDRVRVSPLCWLARFGRSRRRPLRAVRERCCGTATRLAKPVRAVTHPASYHQSARRRGAGDGRPA